MIRAISYTCNDTRAMKNITSRILLIFTSVCSDGNSIYIFYFFSQSHRWFKKKKKIRRFSKEKQIASSYDLLKVCFFFLILLFLLLRRGFTLQSKPDRVKREREREALVLPCALQRAKDSVAKKKSRKTKTRCTRKGGCINEIVDKRHSIPRI